MVLGWFLLGILFKNEAELRVMGFFGCHHKTVVMGLPLINIIYEDNPKLGLYALPLLMWNPMQLIIGSALTTRLFTWVQNQQMEHAEKEKATEMD